MPPSRIPPEARATVLEYLRNADQEKGVGVLDVVRDIPVGETLVRRCLGLLTEQGLATRELQGPTKPVIWRAVIQSEPKEGA